MAEKNIIVVEDADGVRYGDFDGEFRKMAGPMIVATLVTIIYKDQRVLVAYRERPGSAIRKLEGVDYLMESEGERERGTIIEEKRLVRIEYLPDDHESLKGV